MANVFASAGAGGNNCRLDWSLNFDDAANTITIDATHTHFDGSPAPDPLQALIVVQLSNNAEVSVNLLTGALSSGGQFSQTSPGVMINTGPKTRTGVRMKVSADRAGAMVFSTLYTPPVV